MYFKLGFMNKYFKCESKRPGKIMKPHALKKDALI